MSYFNIHVWNDMKEPWFNKINHEILLRKPSVVNFMSFEESDFCLNFKHQTFFSENNIRANFFLGAYDDPNNPRYDIPSKNCYLYVDPIYHFRRSFRYYDRNLYKSSHQDFQFKLMALMYRFRPHRCMLMDQLTNRNLIDYNAISFQNPHRSRYPFKHWSSFKEIKLPSEKRFTNNDQWTIPYEWHRSFFHVIPETVASKVFITEKTCSVLLGAKLFLVQGDKGFHQTLSDLGFMLYDEIIDYSFDNIEDMEERTKAMLDQAEKVINLKDYNDVYKRLYDKLKHNQQHALSLAVSPPPPEVPQEIIQYYNDFESIY